MTQHIVVGLPHSPQAEQAIIGTILSTPSIIRDITLDVQLFFDPINRIIVNAINRLLSQNKSPDLILVYNNLKENGHNQKVGDFEGLRQFLDYNSKAEFIDEWLAELQRYYRARTIVEMNKEIFNLARKIHETGVDDFINSAENKLSEMSKSIEQKGLRSVSEIALDVLQDLENNYKKEKMSGVPSGFHNLDNILGGFQKSDLVILAARPAMGKTSLALNFAYCASHVQQKKVAFFSLEMSSTQIMHRLFALHGKISSNKFRIADLNQEEWSRLFPCVADFHKNDRLFLDDPGVLNVYDLASRCRRLKREKNGLDLIVVDYLQLMKAGTSFDKNKDNREREISTISMGLKSLAKELDCTVIALSQLNRALESRDDKRPRPSDLRESGSLEQDADQILFVYRDEVYNKMSADAGTAEIIIGKNRHGAIDTVRLGYESQYTNFYNLKD